MSFAEEGFKKYHHRNLEMKHEFRGISIEVEEGGYVTEIVYNKTVKNGKKSTEVDIYRTKISFYGTARKYIKSYALTKVPEKYKKIVAELKKEFQKTTWSKAEFVNYN